jgi:U3 small nucleolar RNA-associated protein 14
MRHLLFYAEQKAKRLSKIKSKEYHKRQNKAARRAAERAGAAAGDVDEAERLAAEEAEFDRAKVRQPTAPSVHDHIVRHGRSDCCCSYSPARHHL